MPSVIILSSALFGVIMLNIIMPGVIMLSVILLSVIMLSVIMLSAIVLIVMAPTEWGEEEEKSFEKIDSFWFRENKIKTFSDRSSSWLRAIKHFSVAREY